MLLCNKCYNIVKSSKCLVCKSNETFNVDDGLSDIISNLNKQFKRLKWNIRTEFCCEGHTNKTTKYDLPHMYIRFKGNIQCLSKLDIKVLKKKISYDFFETFEENFPQNTYTITVHSLKDTLSTKEKMIFTKVKYIFQNYFWNYILYLETL